MSIRADLRLAAVNALIVAGIAGGNVIRGTPRRSFDKDSLPVVFITTDNSEIELEDILGAQGARTQQRTQYLQVHIIDAATDSGGKKWVEDELDVHAKAVELALNAAPVAGLANWFLQSEETIVNDEDGDNLAAELVMNYAAQYFTLEGDNSTII